MVQVSSPQVPAKGGAKPKTELSPSGLSAPMRVMKIRWDGLDAPHDGKSLRTLNGARFGWTRAGGKATHGGIDLEAAVGTPVFAIADGVVKKVDPNHGNYGVSVLIKFRLEDRWLQRVRALPQVDPAGVMYALYAHLKPGSVRVADGQRVKRGQTWLADTGISGNGDQKYPHLHFEIRKTRWAGQTNTTTGMANRLDPELLFGVDFIEPYLALARRAATG